VSVWQVFARATTRKTNVNKSK